MRGAAPISFTADRNRTFAGHHTLKWRHSANHKRVAALERAFGSADGRTLKGKPQGRCRHETRPAGCGRMKALRA
jgi:hypothetical protein